MSFNQKKQETKKEVIAYDKFIAGALLKFESLDNVDFSLLVEDFETKTNTKIKDIYYDNNLDRYIKKFNNGTIKLKTGISLDDFIEEENCTLRDKLLWMAGNKVNIYFSNLNIEKFKQKKEIALLKNKDKVLKTANVLLISDIQDDYNALLKYGFKNVDYFKSIIRAGQYFAKHPEELKKYHIVLKGNQAVQEWNFDFPELDRKFDKLDHVIQLSLNKYNYSDHIEFTTYLNDKINNRNWAEQENSYTSIFDRIVENTLINHTLEKARLKNKKFIPISDYINPTRLSLPTKKADLKILYLDSIYFDSIRVSKHTDRIINELGLNVDFKKDYNFSLDKYVISNLGKYDIIIATRIYSGNILNMNYESTEQCKDTGRELTLLVAQNDFYYGFDPDLADGIHLEYVFGGNYAPDSGKHEKRIRILRQLTKDETKEEYWTKYEQIEFSKTKGIIEASVNFYNQALIQKGKPAIIDLDFKTAEELDHDYVIVNENNNAIKEAELAPIREYDLIRWEVLRYLNNLKRGLINKAPEGLRITELKDNIKVEIIYEGRTTCSIIFSKTEYYKEADLRIFDIQTISKKGYLIAPQTIGLYTSKLENFENIPNRPNEIQKRALSSILKKINYSLKPLNDEVLYRKSGFNNQTKDSFSIKKRKKFSK